MKKKILLSFLLLLFVAGTLQAQSRSKGKSLKIEWSQSKKSKTRPTYFLGENSDGDYVFLAARMSSVPMPFLTIINLKDFVRIYDQNFQFKKDQRLEIKVDRYYAIWTGFFYSIPTIEIKSSIKLGGNNYLLMKQKNKTKGYDYFAQKIDIDNYALGDRAELFTYNSSPKNQLGGSIENALSPNKKAGIFYYPLKADKSKKKKKKKDSNGNKAEYKYYIVNDNMEVVSEGKVTSERDNHMTYLSKVIVNDDGAALFTFTQREQRQKGKGKKKKALETRIQFILKSKEGEPDELEMEDLNPEDIESISSKVMPDNTFMLFGTIRNGAEKIKERMFIYSFNEAGEVVSKTLPEGYQSNEMSKPDAEDDQANEEEEVDSKSKKKSKKRTEKKSKKTRDYGNLGTLLLRDIITLEDSSYYFVCERYNHYIYTQTTRHSNGTTTTTTYYVYEYGNIEVFKFNTENEFEWQKTIHRYSSYTFGSSMADPFVMGNSTNEFKTYYSFCYVNRGGSLHFIFPDREENTKNAAVVSAKGANAVMHVKLETGGSINKSLLSSKTKDPEYVLPNFVSTQAINKDRLIFVGFKGLTGKKAKIGVLNF